MEKKYFFGFTLIEVMVAVSILAILILLVFSTFTRQIIKGNDAKRKANLDRIKIAVEEFEKDRNCYPLIVDCPTDTGLDPYLKTIPCDPVTGEPYGYDHEDVPSCPSWFRMYAGLQNTKDTSLLPGIGPEGAYNYYVSSPNAPVPTPAAGDFSYGCISQSCEPVYKRDGRYCSPNFPDPECGASQGKGCTGPNAWPECVY